jgi:hypothetical protein
MKILLNAFSIFLCWLCRSDNNVRMIFAEPWGGYHIVPAAF